MLRRIDWTSFAERPTSELPGTNHGQPICNREIEASRQISSGDVCSPTIEMRIGRLRAIACLSLLAVGAHAEAGPASGVRLSFVRAENAADCITALTLEREIVRRMGRNPFEGDARQWIEGIIERQSGYIELQLFERDAEGRTVGSRRLREQPGDCHRMDDAIELAIALIIDPTAVLAPASPSAPDATATPIDATPTFPSLPPAARVSRAADAPPLALSVAPGPAVLQRAEPTSRQTYRRAGAAFVTLDAVAVSGVLPGVAPGAELTTRVGLDARNRFALRWSALFLPEKQHSNNAGDLGYSLTAMEAGACVGTSKARVIGFGCAAFGLGAMHSVVHNPDPFKPDDRLWAAFRVEAGIDLQVAGPVWVDVRIFDFVAPRLWKYNVVINGQPTQAFAQSPFMPGAALGLGLSF